jgi:hypothetical protein
MNDRCSYTLAIENRNAILCNRPAVSVYQRNGETLFRCRRHDTQRVRDFADEKGYLRVDRMNIRIITPPVAATAPEHDLVALTEYICRTTGADNPGGGLGGEYGYGVEFENDTFSMWPFYWGECECGWDAKSYDGSHDPACYQVELAAREEAEGIGFDPDSFQSRGAARGLSYDDQRAIQERIYRELTAKYGLSAFGGAVHCTCAFGARYVVWFDREKCGPNGHDEACPTVRPNFLHKSTGLAIRWYKWIGRDMEWSRVPSSDEWRGIFNECVASVAA